MFLSFTIQCYFVVDYDVACKVVDLAVDQVVDKGVDHASLPLGTLSDSTLANVTCFDPPSHPCHMVWPMIWTLPYSLVYCIGKPRTLFLGFVP